MKAPQRSQVRVIVLVVVLVVALGAVGYFRFYRPQRMAARAASSAPASTAATQLSSKEDLWAKAEEVRTNEDWYQGQEIFQRLALIDPANPKVYNNLGLIYKKLGKTKQAYQQYEKALAIDPNYPEALNNLGSLLLADTRLNEAKEKLSRAVTLKEDYPDPYFNLGVILEAQGDAKGAINYYGEFLQRGQDLDADLRSQVEQRIKLLQRRL